MTKKAKTLREQYPRATGYASGSTDSYFPTGDTRDWDPRLQPYLEKAEAHLKALRWGKMKAMREGMKWMDAYTEYRDNYQKITKAVHKKCNDYARKVTGHAEVLSDLSDKIEDIYY